MTYLPALYNRVSDAVRPISPAALLLIAGVGAGCESIAPGDVALARSGAAPAPRSDVHRVRAFQDAEIIAAGGEGRRAAVGRGESMAPLFGDTTMLVLTQVPFDELEPGLMVAYRTQQGIQVVHRLIKRQGADAWQVQGVNNPREDAEPLTRLNYLGVVYASLAHEGPEEASAAPESDERSVAP